MQSNPVANDIDNKSLIEVIEVSARDGLQNEPGVLATTNKIDLIERSIAAGAKRIEVASFVHPKLVPQMADAEAVCGGLNHSDDVNRIGLVLNSKGLDRALAVNDRTGGILSEISCVAVAADGFGKQNQNQTVQQSIEVCGQLLRRSQQAGLRAQVVVSVAFGCPFDGEVPVQQTIDVVKALAEFDPLEIALADTIGVAVPTHVSEVFNTASEAVAGEIPLRAHFHDTRHTAVANAYAALDAGVLRFDSSIGGIGGCPFAPKASGNVATEDLLYLFHRLGYQTDFDLHRTNEVANWLQRVLGRPLPGAVSKAGDFPAPESDCATV